MELELGWGIHATGGSSSRFSDARRMETEYLRRLLDFCEEAEIPFSFDIVGYLLNESYEPIPDAPHEDDWLPVPEGSDRHSHPLFYAPDLVTDIVERAADYEICSHTYTHPILGDCPEAVVRWELERSYEKHVAHGLGEPVSFVPPRHSEPPLELVSEAGFKVMRAATSTCQLSNIKQFVHFFTRTLPVGQPTQDTGLTKTHSTQNTSLTSPLLKSGQKRTHPTLQMVPKPVRRKAHARFLESGLQRAIDRNSHVHYWTHLFNLSNDVHWPVVRDFLERLGAASRAGDVEFATMKQLARGDF